VYIFFVKIFSVAMCILLVKKLESILFSVRVNIVSGDNYDKEWKFKERHAKMWEILRGRKDTLAPVVSTLRGERPRRRPRRSDASVPRAALVSTWTNR